MPKKVKKKSAKKKAKKEKKDDDDEEKPTFEVPEYRDPDIYTPRAKLKIMLANHVSTKLGKFTFNSIINSIYKFSKSVSNAFLFLNSN